MGNQSSRFRLVKEPKRIPVPGGKLIEELFGRVNTGTTQFSLAHMVAPAGWGEPAQTPEFGELTLLVRGRLSVEVAGATHVLEAGQAIWIEPGERVRYGNPHGETCEYYALCLPAFGPDIVHREADEAG